MKADIELHLDRLLPNVFNEKYVSKYIKGIPFHRRDFHKLIGVDAFAEVVCRQELASRIAEAIVRIKSLGVSANNINHLLVESFIYAERFGGVDAFSISSHALQSGSPVLREKPQYRHVGIIARAIEELSASTGLNIKYHSLLNDVDHLFAAGNFEQLWSNNLEMLSELSNVRSERLSHVDGKLLEHLKLNWCDFVDTACLRDRCEEFTSKQHTLVNFSAVPEFAENQIMNYALVGLYLEKVFPFGILIDVQKNRYPFEQPFYNYCRSSKLAIIFTGQGKNMKGNAKSAL